MNLNLLKKAAASALPAFKVPANGRQRWEKAKDVLNEGFFKPDIEAAKVLFASVAAHRIADYPPTWNMLIAPSGSMKTALLNTLKGLPSVHIIDEVTENTFISGMIDKSQASKKTKKEQMPASLLKRIGKEGIVIIPDFSTILSMNKNKQPVILSQLRRIYDGSFTREFGTAENLDDRIWDGRITLVAGVTPEFDRYHSVFQSLGERFVRTRWPRAGGIEAALRAMRQKTEEAALVKAAVHNLLSPIMEAKSIPAPRLREEDEIRIANLGELIALGRAPVTRERYTHHIEGTPDAEGNTRLPQQIAQIGRGWAALIGDDEVSEEGMRLIAHIGFACIPPNRAEVLKALISGQNPYSIGSAHTVIERSIEDLVHVGLLEKPGREVKLSAQAVSLLDGARMPRPCSVSPQLLLENERKYVN